MKIISRTSVGYNLDNFFSKVLHSNGIKIQKTQNPPFEAKWMQKTQRYQSIIGTPSFCMTSIAHTKSFQQRNIP